VPSLFEIFAPPATWKLLASCPRTTLSDSVNLEMLHPTFDRWWESYKPPNQAWFDPSRRVTPPL